MKRKIETEKPKAVITTVISILRLFVGKKEARD